jgi:peptidoglycan/xylan/chitin deacetylase (PgdA/CDA1 family)
MKHISWFIISIFLLAFISCKKFPDPIKKGGIVITFDDEHVSEWYLADSLLNKYHWKATFCICHFYRLTTDEIHKLHVLQDAGHEIAGHGLNHLDAVQYVSQYGISSYLNEEIIPMIKIMNKESFMVNSFAYPHGNRDEKLDFALLHYFNIIRGITNLRNNCYFNNSPIVFGIGIDSIFVHGENYILDLLNYAKTNNKILIVYSHTIHNVKGSGVKISTLNLICNYINENDMEYYTLSDLKKLLE